MRSRWTVVLLCACLVLSGHLASGTPTTSLPTSSASSQSSGTSDLAPHETSPIPIASSLAPELSGPALKTTDQEPDVSSQKPEVSSDGPETTSHGTEMSSQAPEASSHLQEASSHGPEASSQAPETSSHVQEASTHGPMASSQGPETSNQVQEASSHGPQASSQEPEASSHVPEASSQVATVESSKIPEVISQTPDIISHTPEVGSTTSDAVDNAPEVNSHPPETSSPASEVNSGSMARNRIQETTTTSDRNEGTRSQEVTSAGSSQPPETISDSPVPSTRQPEFNSEIPFVSTKTSVQVPEATSAQAGVNSPTLNGQAGSTVSIVSTDASFPEVASPEISSNRPSDTTLNYDAGSRGTTLQQSGDLPLKGVVTTSAPQSTTEPVTTVLPKSNIVTENSKAATTNGGVTPVISAGITSTLTSDTTPIVVAPSGTTSTSTSLTPASSPVTAATPSSVSVSSGTAATSVASSETETTQTDDNNTSATSSNVSSTASPIVAVLKNPGTVSLSSPDVLLVARNDNRSKNRKSDKNENLSANNGSLQHDVDVNTNVTRNETEDVEVYLTAENGGIEEMEGSDIQQNETNRIEPYVVVLEKSTSVMEQPFSKIQETSRKSLGADPTKKPLPETTKEMATSHSATPTVAAPALVTKSASSTVLPNATTSTATEITSHAAEVSSSTPPSSNDTSRSSAGGDFPSDDSAKGDVEYHLSYENHRVTGIIRIIKGATWTADLTDRKSKDFNVLASRVKLQLEAVYRTESLNPYLKDIEIDSFSAYNSTKYSLFIPVGNESTVLVMFTLVFTSTVDWLDGRKLRKMLNSCMHNGHLGGFLLDAEYTNFRVPWPDDSQPLELGTGDPPIPQWAIAVIVVAAACLIFSLLFAAVTVYGRGQSGPGGKLYDREDILESPCPDWERKMAAAYENMAADNISDNSPPKRRSFREEPLRRPLDTSDSLRRPSSFRRHDPESSYTVNS